MLLGVGALGLFGPVRQLLLHHNQERRKFREHNCSTVVPKQDYFSPNMGQ
jgi:hypothetical protein